MNKINLQQSSVAKIMNTEHWSNKIIYGFYTAFGSLFLFTLLFTFFKTINVMMTLPQSAAVGTASGILLLYIVLQGMLSYGFFYCRKWLVAVLGIHILITVSAAVLLFPILDLSANTQPTLQGVSVFLIPFFFSFFTKEVHEGVLLRYKAVIPYTLILITLLVIHILLAGGSF